MVRVAIVDDEKNIIYHIKQVADKFFDERQIPHEVICYQYPKELLWDLQDKSYFDIFLLDIEMNINGLEVAHAIRQLYSEPYIIFITWYVKYSLKGYEYNVYRYIIKDEVDEKLPEALEVIHNKLEKREVKQYIIETATKISKINYSDLFYMYIDGKYTYFCTRNGIDRMRKTLGVVFKELNANEFVYINKSNIVNLQHVMALGDKTVILRNGHELPVSIPQFKNLKKAISHYWRNEQ